MDENERGDNLYYKERQREREEKEKEGKRGKQSSNLSSIYRGAPLVLWLMKWESDPSVIPFNGHESWQEREREYDIFQHPPKPLQHTLFTQMDLIIIKVMVVFVIATRVAGYLLIIDSFSNFSRQKRDF